MCYNNYSSKEATDQTAPSRATARKPKRRQIRTQAIASGVPPQADIHAEARSRFTLRTLKTWESLSLHSRYSFTHQGERERQTLFLLFLVMKKETKTRYSGLAACRVDLHCNSYSDESQITVRDTNTGDSLEIEGMTNTALRGAVFSFVDYQGYRKDNAEAVQFLRKLSEHVAKALETEAA